MHRAKAMISLIAGIHFLTAPLVVADPHDQPGLGNDSLFVTAAAGDTSQRGAVVKTIGAARAHDTGPASGQYQPSSNPATVRNALIVVAVIILVARLIL